jgi:hypothetical protein
MGNNTASTETTIGELKAEMARPRAAASAREHSLPEAEELFEIAGYGWMRSARHLKREFRVEYAMKFMVQVPDRNGHVRPSLDAGCTECFIESLNKAPIPDGDYVLHFDNDGIHHVRKSSGQWVYLAIPS